MRLGYLTVPFLDRPLEAALDMAVWFGLDAVELPAGGYFGTAHLDVIALRDDAAARELIKQQVASRGLEISALALHGNPVHPSVESRDEYRRQFDAACAVAESLGVRHITLLAGLPAGGPDDRCPNWIVFPLPAEFESALRWQWADVLIPYWRDAARRASDRGVTLCFEMVPADCVYNPRSFLRLRDALDVEVKCNLDPSHFFHQGIDPVAAIHALGDSIGSVHAKDAALHAEVAKVDGLLDVTALGDVERRGWSYRTIGWGHPESFWRDFIGALRMNHYEGVISIEHEDALLSREEGLGQAVEMLKRIVPREPRENAWWDAGN